MKKIIFLVLLFSIKLYSQNYNKKEQTVKFIYNAIACPCAQWPNFNDKKSKEKFYLIDDKKLTQDAEDFWDSKSLPLIVGRSNWRFF